MPKPRYRYVGDGWSDAEKEESYTEQVPSADPPEEEEPASASAQEENYAAQEFADILEQEKEQGADDELGTGPAGEPTQEEIDAARRATTNAGGDTMGEVMDRAANFTYEDATAEASKYGPQISDLLTNLFGGSYDSFLKGANYLALEKQYKNNARRGMLDTLGQVSARTGGLASSYATGAAQQSYNNEMNNLQQAALEMFSNQQANAYNAMAEAATNNEPAGTTDENNDAGTDDELGTDNSSTLFDDMLASGSPASYLAANYKEYGLAYSAISKVLAEYENWAKNQGSADTDIDAGETTDENSEEPEYNVTNQHGDSWVYVAGFGRLSWQELEYYVDNGQIMEQIIGNKVNYKKAK